MSVIRVGLNLCKNKFFNPTISLQPRITVIVGAMATRNLSTLDVTKNICLISTDKIDGELKHLRLIPPQEKPLVVMLSWLLAKKKHVNKYAKIYADRGFNVLNVSVTPWQLLWPKKGTQVAQDVLQFIYQNYSNSPLFLHGFSVGAYVWGEVLVKMAAELPKYQPVMDRVIGQVWDSAADITEIPVGFPVAVFPKNPVMQSAGNQLHAASSLTILKPFFIRLKPSSFSIFVSGSLFTRSAYKIFVFTSLCRLLVASGLSTPKATFLHLQEYAAVALTLSSLGLVYLAFLFLLSSLILYRSLMYKLRYAFFEDFPFPEFSFFPKSLII